MFLHRIVYVAFYENASTADGKTKHVERDILYM